MTNVLECAAECIASADQFSKSEYHSVREYSDHVRSRD